jgi:DNA polymerase III delta prime subunit
MFSKTLLHQAYGVIGEREAALKEISSFAEKVLLVRTRANPDFTLFLANTLSIDTAREIAGVAALRPAGGGRRVIVAVSNQMTLEAQNALLKTIEEPGEGTHFFIVVPGEGRIIPTLRSRLHSVTLGGPRERAEGARFLAESLPTRLAFARELSDEIGDEKRVREDVVSFLNSLEAALQPALLKSAPPISAARILMESRRMLLSRGMPVRMILEHLAVTLPRINENSKFKIQKSKLQH